jgi:hypothetical protein
LESCGAYFKEIEVLLDKLLMLKLESGSYYNQVMLRGLPISAPQLSHIGVDVEINRTSHRSEYKLNAVCHEWFS